MRHLFALFSTTQKKKRACQKRANEEYESASKGSWAVVSRGCLYHSLQSNPANGKIYGPRAPIKVSEGGTRVHRSTYSANRVHFSPEIHSGAYRRRFDWLAAVTVFAVRRPSHAQAKRGNASLYHQTRCFRQKISPPDNKGPCSDGGTLQRDCRTL